MTFAAWIGREIRAKDRLDEGLADRWLATFDLAKPHPPIMPQGIHFALCTPQARSDCLGEDGHPARDDSPQSFLPPFPMPRRMWASSKMQFYAPITIDAVIERRSKVVAVSEKDGGSGRLAFVDVEHMTRANGTVAVIETQTLVYREAAAPDAPLSPPPPGEGAFDPSAWDAHRSLVPSTALLFRYSALTFNGHRIHYDRRYVTEVEGYPGLIVHGPLIATLLMDLLRRNRPDAQVRAFEFKALRPTFDTQSFSVHGQMAPDGRSVRLWGRDADGWLTMDARATLA